MGKGNRSKELRISENQVTANPEGKLSKMQLIKQQEKKKKTRRYITIAASLVIVVAIIGGIFACSSFRTPKLEGVTAATCGDYELDNAMMAYFLYSQYHTYINQYSYYLPYLGLDTTKSLKSQIMPGSSISWFVYFMNLAKTQVNELVALAQEAQEKGYTLDEEERQEIADTMDGLKKSAKQYGYSSVNSYLAAVYVKGVTSKSVQKCLELQTLAAKYYEDLLETYEYTEEELEKYVEDNKSAFYKFDYLYYDFDADFDSDATDAEKAAAIGKAKADADKFLSDVETEEEFREKINQLEKEKADAKAETDTGSSSETGSSSSDTEKNYSDDFFEEGEYYKEDDPFTEWAYDEERASGDTTVIENTDSDEVVTGYTVYYLKKTAYLDDYLTKNVRHVLFLTSSYENKEAARAEAERVLEEFRNGEVSEDAFAALAEKYSEDEGSHENGGLYENVGKDEMVEEFNDWIYDEDRKVGDLDIVETSYGAHIMYFVGDGIEKWKADAEDALKGEQYDKEIEELQKKFPVVYNDEKLVSIP